MTLFLRLSVGYEGTRHACFSNSCLGRYSIVKILNFIKTRSRKRLYFELCKDAIYRVSTLLSFCVMQGLLESL
jgi:hypothetical protein